ncbi:hypothetical protein HCTV-16_gp164 [Haloarcula virus HCTV-16]|nr:hypothetical protein HCTV-16_gp164 [Haloarcula virus HCTV-16]
MNDEQRYFDGVHEYYEDPPEQCVRYFYNSRVSDNCDEIPAPLAVQAWKAYDEQFWDERLSTESRSRIWELLPFF